MCVCGCEGPWRQRLTLEERIWSHSTPSWREDGTESSTLRWSSSSTMPRSRGDGEERERGEVQMKPSTQIMHVQAKVFRYHAYYNYTSVVLAHVIMQYMCVLERMHYLRVSE